MTELSPRARSLLAQARAASNPTAADAAIVLAGLGALAPGAAAGAGTSLAAAAKGTSLGALKITLAFTLAVGAGVATTRAALPGLRSATPRAAGVHRTPAQVASAAGSSGVSAAPRQQDSRATGATIATGAGERATGNNAPATSPMGSGARAAGRATRANAPATSPVASGARAAEGNSGAAPMGSADPIQRAAVPMGSADPVQRAAVPMGSADPAVPNELHTVDVRPAPAGSAVPALAQTPSDAAGTSATGVDPCAAAAELIAVRRAQSQLTSAPRESLSTLEAWEQHCGTGALTQERVALRALALCGLKQFDEGRVPLAELRTKFPTSPALQRVERACTSP